MINAAPVTRVYNEGDLGNLPCGWRSIIALPAGRRWVTIVDWTTLDTARLPAQLWHAIPKQNPGKISRRRILAHMLQRQRYVTPTRAIKAAIALLRRPPANPADRDKSPSGEGKGRRPGSRGKLSVLRRNP